MHRSRLAGAVCLLVFHGAFPASADSKTGRDTYRSLQWGLDRIEVEAAWETSTGKGALIAIVDTGVDRRHPDLGEKLVWFDDADLVDPSGIDGPQDESAHGTGVAGLAAAVTENAEGIAGVAPDARLLPVRIAEWTGVAPQAAVDSVAAGVRYAVRRKADVINLSLGFHDFEEAVTDFSGLFAAIGEAWTAGAVIVAAADNKPLPFCDIPGRYPHVICVGGANPDDQRVVTSAFDASDANFVLAPHGDVPCTPRGTYTTITLAIARDPSFQAFQRVCGIEPGDPYAGHAYGTSGAVPHVAGIAALLVAMKKFTNEQIVQRILTTADDIAPQGRDANSGYGRVNARKAIEGR